MTFKTKWKLCAHGEPLNVHIFLCIVGFFALSDSNTPDIVDLLMYYNNHIFKKIETDKIKYRFVSSLSPIYVNATHIPIK